MERQLAYRETGFADIMRALLLLAALHVCTAAAADVSPTQRDMQRAVLIDRDIDKVERYLKAGFDPRSAIGCGTFDVMDGAVQIQNPNMVALLLRYGVHPKESTFVQAALLPSPDIDGDGRTALGIARDKADSAIVACYFEPASISHEYARRNNCEAARGSSVSW